MPGIMTVFGVLTLWLGWLAERGGKPAQWKWLGVLFLLIGMWSGYEYFGLMIGSSPEAEIYRAGLPSIRRYTYAHYVAFFLPLVGLIGGVALQFLKRPSGAPAAADQ